MTLTCGEMVKILIANLEQLKLSSKSCIKKFKYQNLKHIKHSYKDRVWLKYPL